MKKNLLLLTILVVGICAYLGINFITSMPEKNDAIHLDFQKMSYNSLKTPDLEIMSGEVVGQTPTDAMKVSEFLDELREISVQSIASRKPENFALFGITESSPTLEIDGKKYLLGALQGYDKQFIKPAEEEAIYLIDTNLSGLLGIRGKDYFKTRVEVESDKQETKN